MAQPERREDVLHPFAEGTSLGFSERWFSWARQVDPPLFVEHGMFVVYAAPPYNPPAMLALALVLHDAADICVYRHSPTPVTATGPHRR